MNNDYGSNFVESVTRSNRLYCSRCLKKLPKGVEVVFGLTEDGEFENVYCMDCVNSDEYIRMELVVEKHPFDLGG